MFGAVKGTGVRWSLLSAAMIALAAVGCGDQVSGGSNNGGGNNGGGNNTAANLSLGSNANLGNILVSAEGRTLYYFALDLPGSGGQAAVSNCVGGCLAIWPIFHVDAPVVGAGLTASDFGELVRADGAKQTTFKGLPLYLFAGDARAGDTNGDNLGDPTPNDLWYVIKDPFYSALVLTKAGGPDRYLADPTGRALYFDSQDTVGNASSDPVPACVGACVTKWPVFAAASGSLPTGVDPAKLTTFTRADGAKQSAFDGHPLYYFSGDSAQGDTKGHGVNAAFDTVNPSIL
jgi:predicted lipoprotein with Yx(FWY)xxD motif